MTVYGAGEREPAGTPHSPVPPAPPPASGPPGSPGPYPVPSQYPSPPGMPRAQPQFPTSPPPAVPPPPSQPSPPGAQPPQSAPPVTGHPGFASPGGAYPPVERPRRTWPGLVALLLVLVLAVVTAVLSFQVMRLSDNLEAAEARLSQENLDDASRIDSLERRAAELEQAAGAAFDPAAIAEAVLPSVFRVRAGGATGTAFAVGAPTDDGGTNLFTNYHVVQDVWDVGGREVTLERSNQSYPATIVEIDRGADIAWLRTDNAFTGLSAASAPVRSGEQIVSVGAPLGLTDTVTTGVVSAVDRNLSDGSGPWIQFDAAVNPGNSGGPVINAAKEVVGVTTEKARDADGIGLAVPMTVACDLFDIC